MPPVDLIDLAGAPTKASASTEDASRGVGNLPKTRWADMPVEEHIRYCRELADYCEISYADLKREHFLIYIPKWGRSLKGLYGFYRTEAADVLRNEPGLPAPLSRLRSTSEPLNTFEKALKAVLADSSNCWERMTPAVHVEFCKLAAKVLKKDYRHLKTKDLTQTKIPKLGGRTLERLYAFYREAAAAPFKDYPGLPPLLSGKGQPFSTFEEAWAELRSKAGYIPQKTLDRMSGEDHIELLKILARQCEVEDYRWLKAEHFKVTIPALGTDVRGLYDYYHSAEGQARRLEVELPYALSGRYPFRSLEEVRTLFVKGNLYWSGCDVKWQVELLKVIAHERGHRSYRELRASDLKVPIAAFEGLDFQSLLTCYRSSASAADRSDPRLPASLRIEVPTDASQAIELLSVGVMIKWDRLPTEKLIQIFVDLSRSLAASLKKPFEALVSEDYQAKVPFLSERNLMPILRHFQRELAKGVYTPEQLRDLPPTIMAQVQALPAASALSVVDPQVAQRQSGLGAASFGANGHQYRHPPEREFKHEITPEVACILSRSVDPKRDSAIFQADRARGGVITLDRLTAMYAAGYHSIPHLQYFERADAVVEPESKSTRTALDFQELLARTLPVFSAAERVKLECLFDQCDPVLQPYIVQTAQMLDRHAGSIDGIGQLLTALHNECSFDRQTTLELVSLLPHFGEQAKEALLRFCQLAGLPPEYSSQFTAAFQSFTLEALYPGYRPSDQELAQRSIEKLRRAFLAKQGPDGQPIPEAELDRALRLLPLVKAGQSELQELKFFEVKRKAEALWQEGGAPASEELQVEFLALAQAVHKNCPEKSARDAQNPVPKKLLFSYAANDTQLVTLLLLMGDPHDPVKVGRCAQVKTGEGKTLELAYLATYRSISGQKVHIESPTDLLAQVHVDQYREFYKAFRFDCEHFRCVQKAQGDSIGAFSGISRPRNRPSINIDPEGRCPVIHVAIQESYVFAGLMERHYEQEPIPKDRALLDEVDLQNDTTKVIHQLSGAGRVTISPDSLRTLGQYVTTHGVDWVAGHLKTSTDQLRGAIPEMQDLPPQIAALYIQSEIVSRSMVHRRDYVKEDGRVVIVDYQNTGRLLETRWMYGLEAIIALREGLNLPRESRSLTEISGINHWRSYGAVSGVTGTLGPETERHWFNEALGLQRDFDAPPHTPSRAVHDRPQMVSNDTQQIAIAIDRVKSIQEQGRAMIVTLSSIKEAKQWHDVFKAAGIKAQLLTGKEDLNLDDTDRVVNPEDVVKRAGEKGMITIVTTFGSRGIDFRPGSEVLENGGLHNFIGLISINARLLDQIRGRVARQGEMGSSEVVISWSSDRFIAELPAPARDFLLQTFTESGAYAPEFFLALDLLQRATYVQQGIVRRATVVKDSQMQHALESLYGIVHTEATRAYARDSKLAQLNLFAKVMGEPGSKYGIEEVWSTAVEQVKALVRYHRVYRNRADEAETELPLSGEVCRQLQDAFQRALGGPLPEVDKATKFQASVLDLQSFYQRYLGSVEFQNGPCSSDALEIALQSSAALIAAAASERVKKLVNRYTAGGTSRIVDYYKKPGDLVER